MKLDEQYILYALGELEPEEEKEIEVQLQQNPELMTEVEKIRHADTLLADVFAQNDESWKRDEITQSEDKVVSCDNKDSTTRNSQLATGKSHTWRLILTLATLILIAIGGVIMFFPLLGGRNYEIATYSSHEDIATECMPATTSDITDDSDISTEDDAIVTKDMAPTKVEEDEDTPTFKTVDQPHKDSRDLELVKQFDSPCFQENQLDTVPDSENTTPAIKYAAAPVIEYAAAPAPISAMETPRVPEKKYAGRTLHVEMDNLPGSENDIPAFSKTIGKSELLSEESESNESEYDPMIAMLLDSEMFKDCLDKIHHFKADTPLVNNTMIEKFSQQYSTTQKQVLYRLLCSCIQEENLPQIVLQYFDLTVPDMTNRTVADLSKDERFALAVVRFIDIIQKPKLRTTENFKEVLTLLSDSVEKDGKRLEFKTIVEKAISLKSEKEKQ